MEQSFVLITASRENWLTTNSLAQKFNKTRNENFVWNIKFLNTDN